MQLNDPQVAQLYSRNFHVQHVFAAGDESLEEPVPWKCIHQNSILYVGDVQDVAWMKLLPRSTNLALMASPPCPPWCRSSDKDGLLHPEGQLFVKMLPLFRFARPKAVLVENVDSIQSHQRFQGLLDMFRWSGYKQVREATPDLGRIAPVTRKRWLSIFVPVDGTWALPRLADFVVLPNVSLRAFRTLILLPQEHEWLSTLDSDLKSIYEDWQLFHKGTRMPRSEQDVLALRTKGPQSVLATLLAIYGKQHDLPKHMLVSRGLFSELLEGRFGTRFISPIKGSILHCLIMPMCFPIHGHLAHHVVGNFAYRCPMQF